jgi:membrane fusion protein (multidrug efflux system)
MLTGATLLLGAWSAWFLAVQVAVYEVSHSARLEVDRAAHAVEAQVGGRVVTSRLGLGRQVAEGEILIELDASPLRLELEEQRARLRAARAQLAVLGDERAVESGALRQDRQGTQATLGNARAKYEEADAEARHSAEQAERLGRLHAGGNLSELEWLRAQAEAVKSRAAADALRFDIDRRAWDRRAGDSDRQARLEALRRQIAEVEGQIAVGGAVSERLEHEIDRRSLRAPVAGRLGEIADLPVGAYVREGGRVAVVVPSGDIRVVAQLVPGDALGRVRPGQPARLRLDGFPWTQYGSAEARVASVATEPTAGLVRAELIVRPGSNPRLPFQHGLPGVVEIEVERVTPATMVLRAAGRLLARSTANGSVP